ncbi:HD domain-containing protein [Couchioplanes caeruleus]|uniref:HD domain-containing protein n=1 Tax=Couchioplanes caeruleus TaxID=56438 RepID=UPI0020BE9FB6|nr:HD domain-containing protein [Couchioplanes caeruleus]UQU67330.1 HD domain-containing protein [Couchioplanes caeruleus]
MARILSDSDRNDDIPLVYNAFEVADRAHRGQRRRSGDPYITHPVEVATIVAGNGGSTPAICAALLHDVIEDTPVRPAGLRAEFGAEITGTVEALTAGAIRTPDPVGREVMLVAVADRLHNLRTLRPCPPASRRRASLDTLVLHVPMARRLDMPAVAAELTELACSTLDDLDRGPAARHRGLIAAAVRRVDPVRAAEAVAAAGGAAVLGGGIDPELALATGGTGLVALAAAVLLGRDPEAARRLARLLEAWRRR